MRYRVCLATTQLMYGSPPHSRRNHKDSPPPELLSWLEHNGNVADGMVRRGNRPWEPSRSWRALLHDWLIGTAVAAVGGLGSGDALGVGVLTGGVCQ